MVYREFLHVPESCQAVIQMPSQVAKISDIFKEPGSPLPRVSWEALNPEEEQVVPVVEEAEDQIEEQTMCCVFPSLQVVLDAVEAHLETAGAVIAYLNPF
eukprot:s3101_g12.t1